MAALLERPAGREVLQHTLPSLQVFFMIDQTNMPPWLELPKEVRRRVVARFDAEEPASPSELELCQTELLELGMYRLIEHFGGNVRKAMKHARRHSVNPQGWPTEVKDWELAHQRVKERIAQRTDDPVFRQKAAHLLAVVN